MKIGIDIVRAILPKYSNSSSADGVIMFGGATITASAPSSSALWLYCSARLVP